MAQESKVLLSVDEAAVALSLGRSAVYDLIMRKELASIKVGRTRRVPVVALHQYVQRRLEEGE
jgi:excisionase family DNA binding protein